VNQRSSHADHTTYGSHTADAMALMADVLTISGQVSTNMPTMIVRKDDPMRFQKLDMLQWLVSQGYFRRSGEGYQHTFKGYAMASSMVMPPPLLERPDNNLMRQLFLQVFAAWIEYIVARPSDAEEAPRNT